MIIFRLCVNFWRWGWVGDKVYRVCLGFFLGVRIFLFFCCIVLDKRVFFEGLKFIFYELNIFFGGLWEGYI